ncbi:MAG: (d)CMP kinase [Planctomycetales bacterium]
MIITIDGPAGSGKSTAAKGLAQRLGFAFLDTGAMYRAVAWHCLQQGIDLQEKERVAEEARLLDLQMQGEKLSLNGRLLTHEIRTLEVSQNTSIVAANPLVRNVMVELQRKIAEGKNIVTEGRDQGTIVFPQAECKFYLQADPQQRAIRRQQELQEQGSEVDLGDILRQQEERDQRDAQREVAPLKCAADAIQVDTSGLTRDEVLALLQSYVDKRRGNSSPA